MAPDAVAASRPATARRRQPLHGYRWSARVLFSGTRWWTAVAVLAALAMPLSAEDVGERLISVDAAITEIIYALGEEGRLVGIDTTSRYPEATKALPTVGYKRALSAEGIVGLAPSAVLATDEAEPPEVLTQIERAGVPVRQLPDEPTVVGLYEKIRAVAELLGRDAAGAELIARIEADLARIAGPTDAEAARPRVLFLLHFGAGGGRGAGRETAADTVIRLAGGENVLHDAFTGYKPFSAEAALAAAPDVILMTEGYLEELGGIDAVLVRSGLAATPAGQARRVIGMDASLLLGFGPRLGKAATSLARHLGTVTDIE